MVRVTRTIRGPPLSTYGPGDPDHTWTPRRFAIFRGSSRATRGPQRLRRNMENRRARDASRFFVDFSRPAPEAGTVRDHRRKRPDSKKFPPAGLLTGGDSPPGPPPGNRNQNLHLAARAPPPSVLRAVALRAVALRAVALRAARCRAVALRWPKRPAGGRRYFRACTARKSRAPFPCIFVGDSRKIVIFQDFSTKNRTAKRYAPKRPAEWLLTIARQQKY